ncbi:hypothetical protein UFOVP256_10 [uncultured Caudovirales phage]|uniref:Uncharacterized protein n=1 Tax=uncultured Caudovirales phage TaxID=2100421 RepID=A0A6J5LDH3_9CAUD|nr:hypothetical protein UFOVP256_10 [uncultured Caudovirales phage]
MATGLKELVEEIVGEERACDFAAWAFGEEFYDFDEMMMFADAWNERHSDLYTIDPASPIVYDVIKMTELWREHDPAF